MIEMMNKKFSMSYKLEREIERLDVNQDIKSKLAEMKAKIILPKNNNNKRNKLNVYIETAEYIDGLHRICYLRIENDKIEINEYRGARGDRFSGFYKILVKLLMEKGLLEMGNTFSIIIPIDQLKGLIDCFNAISIAAVNGYYELKETNQTYPRIFDSKYYDLKISYFEEAKKFSESDKDACGEDGIRLDRNEADYLILDGCPQKVMEVNTLEQGGGALYGAEIVKGIEKIYRICVEGTGDQFVENYNELKTIKRCVEEWMGECDNRRKMLEKIRGVKL